MRTLLAAAILLGASGLAQAQYNSGVQTVGATTTGTGSVTASTVAGAISSQTGCTTAGNVWQPATNTCVAAPAATVTSASLANLTPALGATTTSSLNGTVLAGQAGTLASLASACSSGCTLQVPPTYSLTDNSRFFTPQLGSAEPYAQHLFFAGTVPTSIAEDDRGGNRWWLSTNEVPAGGTNTYYNSLAPFILEQRATRRMGYADYYSNLLVRQRISGQGAANGGQGVSEKGNFASVVTDSIIRSPLQGGGIFDSMLAHTTFGDDVMRTIQADTFGYSEGEDEQNELDRVFLETSTVRWGATLTATPTLDSAGFGNYFVSGAIASGYSAMQAGEHLPLVNLSRTYSAGNYTSIRTSPYTGFALVAGDTAAGWTARYGTSTTTTIAEAVDSQHRSGCPSTVTDSSPIVPDPTITTEAGVGGLTGYCVKVASTAGYSDGQYPVFVGGASSNYEYAKIVHVVDGTHMTMNLASYHQAAEYISAGGAVGYAWSNKADDIAPGALVGYPTTNATTLHKYYPIMRSDSSGLYVYFNQSASNTISTPGYRSTIPNRPAVVSSVDNTGAITFSDHGDYTTYQTPNIFGDGQNTLSAPTITYAPPSGGSCSVLPVAKPSLVFGGFNAFQSGLVATLTTPGSCTAPPTVTIQSTWAGPYSIAPATYTKKVFDPPTGSLSNGHLLTGTLNPANWQSGDLVEIPSWLHDATHSTRTFGKYWHSGQTPVHGIMDLTNYVGDWGSSEILVGIKNATDGYKYYADATHPQGPGVAYEQPPDGYGFEGNFKIVIPLGLPPQQAFARIGCGALSGFGLLPFNPCQNGTVTPFDLFEFATVPGGTEYDLRYDGQGGLTYNGTFTPSHFRSPDAQFSGLSVGITTTNTPMPSAVAGFLGAYTSYWGCGYGVPVTDPSCEVMASVGGIKDTTVYQAAVDLRVHNNNTGALIGSVLRGWEDGMVALGGAARCTGSKVLCNAASTWGLDSSGKEIAASISTSTPATGSCSSFTGFVTLVVDGTTRKIATCN